MLSLNGSLNLESENPLTTGKQAVVQEDTHIISVYVNNHITTYETVNLEDTIDVTLSSVTNHGRADKYNVWNNYHHISTNENEPGSSHTFTGNNSVFKLTKTKHNGKSKTRIVSEVPTSIKSDFYIGERQKINMERLKPMIKPFDSGRSCILDLSLKLISLLVIWSCNSNNEVKKKVTHLVLSYKVAECMIRSR